MISGRLAATVVDVSVDPAFNMILTMLDRIIRWPTSIFNKLKGRVPFR